jgi:hypothetical protein
MSDVDDLCLDAVERLLADRPACTAPPGYRDRVLAAVRDTLAGHSTLVVKVPATKSGEAGEPPCGDCPDLVAGTFFGIDRSGRVALVAMALSALGVTVAPWLAIPRLAPPVPVEPRIVAQARAAGIELPVESLAAASRQPAEPAAHSSEPLSARLHDAWRLRNLLTGEL